MNRLTHKRALITGGTSGIGLETARQFLAEGARVAITGSSEASIAAARAEQPALAKTIGEAFGGLDIVFVNAGIAELRPVEQWDEAAFDRTLAINLKGPYFLLQALAPLLSNPSSVVLNTSVNAHIGMPTSSVYAASKAGLISLARTLSGEWLARGIRVNAVSPGPITTPLYGKLGLSDADLQKTADSIRALVPVGRFGEPSEVAKAVVFLASDESAFTVGTELMIDGGMSSI